MKKICLITMGIVSAFALQAQDFTDALRYSESFSEGNARFMAMGGATTSLGANVGSISVNPAGSAVFKKSVVELSPSYQYTKSENYYSGYDKAFSSKLKVPSFGIVGYKALKPNSVFISGLSYGFSLNAQNRYDETIQYTAKNATNSLTDDFLRLAQNNYWYDDYNVLADGTKLLAQTTEGEFFTDFRTDAGLVQYGQYQDMAIDREGAKREYLFNFGVDFSEWVFVGADLVLENVYYSETKRITEKDREDMFPDFGQFTYSTNLNVTGNGVGGKFGVLVRPIEYIRIGAAMHTPVKYNISEDYDARLRASFDQDVDGTGVLDKQEKYSSSYEYKIAQPAKFVGSLGFVYKNVANIGVDIETMNYSNCSMNSGEESMSEANELIQTELTKVTNLKCGGEFRYGPFSFRAGYAMYGNPYKNIIGDNFYRNDYSAGVGLATNLVYCDLSWLRAKTKQSNTMYKDFGGNNVTGKSTVKRDYITFTVGVKF